tara:strand:- start:87 stop:473 length:387 start_codon:yes stop_codon:yes gene_type:complete
MVDSSLLGALSLALRTLSNSHETGLLAGASTALIAAVTTACRLGHDHHLLLSSSFFSCSSSGRRVFDAPGNLSNFAIEFSLELTNVSAILVNFVLEIMIGGVSLGFTNTSVNSFNIYLEMFESTTKFC